MNNFFTKGSLLVFFLVVLKTSNAQLSVTTQAGGLKFFGDVGKKSNANFFSDMRLGYGLAVEYRIGKILGVSVDGLYGKLAGTDNDKTSRLNFESKIMGGSLNVHAFFDRIGKNEKVVSPYIHAGVGYLMFDPYGDLRNSYGTMYNYWKDGSIRNLPESAQNEPVAVAIRRDYSYETQLKDTVVNYARNTLFIPIGFGAKFKMGYRTSLRVGAVYNLCLSDYIDNFKSGGNDSWASFNVGINVHFGKKPKDGYTVNLADIDNTDLDEDGVKDLADQCQGTPKGIKVDAKGCPEDKDEDGVFDYMDNELTTQKGAIVDASGVTIDEETLARRQLKFDSLATERNLGFNNAPSDEYLKLVEEKARAAREKIRDGGDPTGTVPTKIDPTKPGSTKSSKIPAEFVEADYDKDGFISASEITKTIDGFFEGESSFTVEKINKLIDFFFEQ